MQLIKVGLMPLCMCVFNLGTELRDSKISTIYSEITVKINLTLYQLH